MKNYSLFFLACIGLCFTSCQSPGETSGLASVSIDTTAIDTYLSTLAADDFLGRKPFTEGETKTVNFLKEELEKMGVAPGNGDSYFQEVPLVETTATPAKTMEVQGPGGNLELEIGEDYVIYTQREQERVDVENAELVFCGYGIVAPEYNWNDYEDIDIEGKIAVVMVNDPGFESQDSTFFKGETMTYYGRWTYKYEEAARQGALGVLIIHETNAAGYPWFVVSSSWSGGRLDLQTPNGNMDKCAVQGWVSLGAAAKIFQTSGMTQGRFFEKAKSANFEPIPLGVTASTSLTNTFKKDVSQNVVGMIRGSERPDEYIIYTAHWDHLGVGEVVAGDSIYNGAVDNASGTAAVLAIAKAFTQLPKAPERSVVFLFVTAEEQGLLGSAYYAENPIFPVEQTVANLNIDAMQSYGPTKDLVIIGYGQSELEDYAQEVAEKQGRYLVADLEPEKGYFFRSDHFSFAKAGIPALYAEAGKDHLTKGKEYGEEKSQEYTANAYHRPADEYVAEEWDLGGIQEDAQLYFEIGQKLAKETTFPKWKEGSEFKAIREESLKPKG
ncbi:MAG TPA: M28 family metallopeptidase [Saprospiraceae bacterium]|nr:M28 family metallopeptidase [Saprospiraceae bacterium]